MPDDKLSANRSQKPDLPGLEGHRKAIENVEYVFDILMPGTFTIKTLMESGDIVSNAIIAIRNSKKQLGQNEGTVLKGLRQAKQQIQLAIDEFETARNNRNRYRYIELASEKLREALSYW